ncbi:type I methionyl aminopeptidase [uncultured Cytophaga sp.]|uniref:type I methionyl aminopeptidase n=1 Tax=uncultured Cytophaga sp. TaxID=160238 RepID=UPI002611F921|nr:type I methionyl aminopeptidase [uncultured Cytophaga sp.]
MSVIHYKSNEELEIIRESGIILGKAHAEIAKIIRPGIKTNELDKIAYQFIADNGGLPSFKGYNGFPATLCISVNEVVVHGFPSEYELQDGDIISVDCGVKYKGFHSDSAYTYPVGNVKEEVLKLLRITKESLYKGIEQAVVGNRIGDIGYAVQTFVENEGYTVVRELVGHGLGKSLHEKPEVPNYGNRGKGLKLEENLVIAIEPMINLGKKNVVQENDGWTIRTSDRLPSAHFEHTVAIKKGKPEILTTFEFIEKIINI